MWTSCAEAGKIGTSYRAPLGLRHGPSHRTSVNIRGIVPPAVVG